VQAGALKFPSMDHPQFPRPPAGQAWTSTVLGSVAKRKRRSEAEVVVASSWWFRLVASAP